MLSWLALRDAMPWARRFVPRQTEPVRGPQNPRVDALRQKYNLGLLALCDEVGRAESLYVLDLCDRFLPPKTGRGLDIGTKNGSYLPGLSAFGPGWDGIERDAHRRYWDLTTRRTRGEGTAGALPDCRYLAGDVRALHGQYSVITWFLPFVFVEPHTAWGLPEGLFDPAGVLAHAWGLLEPGGSMLVINQGEAEYQEQQQLFAPLPASLSLLGRVESALSPFSRPRFGLVARKVISGSSSAP